MLEKFKYQLQSDFPDFGNKKLYLTISGGKDSMVLSHLLLQTGFNHELLHCNFQLRGKESDQDEQFVREYARRNNLNIHVEKFDTQAEINRTGATLQETARNLRYTWFDSFNTGQDVLILTAHHLDDSIETFFINLLRGTGLNGISGIPKHNPPYYRPLSSFSTDEVFKYIDQNQIEYQEDSSNITTKYLRNNLRHGLIPEILNLEPHFKTKMESFFSELNSVKDFLELKADELRSQHLVSNEGILSVPTNVIKTLDTFSIQLLFSNYGIRRSNIEEFTSFLNASTGSLFRVEKYEFLSDRGVIYIRPLSDNIYFEQSLGELPASYSVPSGNIKLEAVSIKDFKIGTNPQYLDKKKVQFPLTIRSWKQGDRITPLGLHGTKLVSDILINQKLSAFEKEKVLVIQDNSGEILLVLGICISDHFKVLDNSDQLISITFL